MDEQSIPGFDVLAPRFQSPSGVCALACGYNDCLLVHIIVSDGRHRQFAIRLVTDADGLTSWPLGTVKMILF